ncbi:outer membrane beta-barrel protein [Notoacmeibacter marinus]|uniref:outer membrane beta-barrel protein n=1 Tax=Notoacmeibacter marinus TaxID=1876515 RepID=UPI0013037AB4|nr:outer membrane beta-barrel protein [Notoacmeibacter marinus]
MRTKRPSILRRHAAFVLSLIGALALPTHAWPQTANDRLLAQVEPRGSLRDLLDEQQQLIDRNLLASDPLPDPIAEAERQQRTQSELFDPAGVPTPRRRPVFGSTGEDRTSTPDEGAIAAGRETEARPERPSFRSRPTDAQQSARPARPSRAADPAVSRQRNAEERRDEEERLVQEEREREQEALSTGGIRQGSTLTPDAEDYERAQPVGAALAQSAGERRDETDPYEAEGIRFGNLILRPSVETGIRVTDNVDLTPQKESAVLSETTLRLEAEADGAESIATIDGFLTYEKALSGPDLSEPEGGVEAVASYNLTRELRLNGSVRYAGDYEGAEAPYSPGVSFTESSFEHSFGSTLGIEKYAGPLRYSITGEADRTVYSDVDTATGTVSQDDRNSSLLNLRLRGGYEISPALIPFAELEVGRRFYDNEVDADGFEHSADRYALRGGVRFDLSDKLSGEIAVGYLTERPDDSRLADVDGWSVEGQVAWSPMRGTDITLGLRTDVEGATTLGASGSLLRGVDLTVSRRLRADLELSAELTAERRDYVATDDEDTILSAEIGATYWMNRSAAIIGRLAHERQTSTLPGRDYRANSAFLGLRLQH